MRTLLVALVLVTASMAQGQEAPPEPAAPEFYTEVGGGGGYGTSLGVIATGSAAIGYRLPSGVALGIHSSAVTVGDQSAFAVGPEVRYAHSLDDRTTLDLHASGSVGFYQGTSFDAAGYQATGLGAQLGASATRRFNLGRGISLATTGGLYGGMTHSFDVDLASGVSAERSTGLGAQAGVIVGTQIEFDALGGRFSIGPYGYLPVISSRRESGFGTGIHRAGGGPQRGFITFQF